MKKPLYILENGKMLTPLNDREAVDSDFNVYRRISRNTVAEVSTGKIFCTTVWEPENENS